MASLQKRPGKRTDLTSVDAAPRLPGFQIVTILSVATLAIVTIIGDMMRPWIHPPATAAHGRGGSIPWRISPITCKFPDQPCTAMSRREGCHLQSRGETALHSGISIKSMNG